MKKAILVLVALLVIGAVAMAGCISSSSDSSQYKDMTGGIGDTITCIKTDGTKINWSVDQVIRGSAADEIIAKGSRFNHRPAAGNEYVMYHMNIQNPSTTDGYTPEYDAWMLYADNVLVEKYTSVDLPKDYPKLIKTDIIIRPGATLSGWVVEEVPIDSNLRLDYWGELLGLKLQGGSVNL